VTEGKREDHKYGEVKDVIKEHHNNSYDSALSTLPCSAHLGMANSFLSASVSFFRRPKTLLSSSMKSSRLPVRRGEEAGGVRQGV
jgi:hypothetical protein